MTCKSLAPLMLTALLAATAASADTEVLIPQPIQKTLADAMKEVAETEASVELALDADGEALGIVMLSDVLFGYGEANLTPEALATLETIAKKLPWVEGVELIGHTDSIGSEAFNEALGQARADAVLAWLETEGFAAPGTIIANSAGETDPVAANVLKNGTDNPEGRAQNRRVEFRILEARTPSVSEEEVATVDLGAPATTVQ